VLRRQAVHRRKQLDAGPFAADVASFGLHLTAENKAAGTVRTYTEAVRWFAAAHLLAQAGRSSWEEVGMQDVQRWIAWLLDRDLRNRHAGVVGSKCDAPDYRARCRRHRRRVGPAG
jgi:hypothetical protein